MATGTIVLVLRGLAAVVFILGALISIRLLSLYKRSLLEEPWLPIFIGVILLALSQPLSEIDAMMDYSADSLHLLRSILVLFASLFLFAGLYRALKIWRRLSNLTAVVMNARDTDAS